jgi:uncharacterized iron-regulated membrane protein
MVGLGMTGSGMVAITAMLMFGTAVSGMTAAVVKAVSRPIVSRRRGEKKEVLCILGNRTSSPDTKII